jgi:signal transduction histidine kinase
MTGKGNLTEAPNRRLRLWLAAHLAWIALVLALGAWWIRLLLRQAEKIVELEHRVGVASADDYWHRTQRMLTWESGTFFILLLATTFFVSWVYFRDLRRSRSLHAFFASVTHELRTPLTSIRLQAESIADALEKDATSHELVTRLLEDTQRLESQVERTLELARVEGGGALYPQPLRLKPWVERLAASWRETQGARLEIRTEIGEETVIADTSAFQVILRNLLENSIRHGKRERVEVTLRAEARDQGVLLRYQDNGEGFAGDPARLGGLFERGAASQGAGVGLYLVKMLMERMGGHSRFRSPPGFEAELWFPGGRNG